MPNQHIFTTEETPSSCKTTFVQRLTATPEFPSPKYDFAATHAPLINENTRNNHASHMASEILTTVNRRNCSTRNSHIAVSYYKYDSYTLQPPYIYFCRHLCALLVRHLVTCTSTVGLACVGSANARRGRSLQQPASYGRRITGHTPVLSERGCAWLQAILHEEIYW